MKKLIAVYKKCRYLDQLIGTSFFHENHFMGLLERVYTDSDPNQINKTQNSTCCFFNQKLFEEASCSSTKPGSSQDNTYSNRNKFQCEILKNKPNENNVYDKIPKKSYTTDSLSSYGKLIVGFMNIHFLIDNVILYYISYFI